MRLIDADEVLAHIKPYDESDESWSCTGGTAIRLLYKAINEAPTVDAVAVIQCKNCKYHRKLTKQEEIYLDEYALICTNANFTEDGWNPVWPGDFCSCGEREENNG